MEHDMELKICALYKTFSGEEFVTESIDSIYEHVSDIVFVHSDVSWLGERGNTVVPVVRDYPDTAGKITSLGGKYRTQIGQYEAGLEYIRRNINCDYIMLIDTDEIWDRAEIRKLINFLHMDDGRSLAVCSRVVTHVKEPRYVVHPPEPLMPVVMIKSSVRDFAGIRGNKIRPRTELHNVHFHHFTMVRSSIESIRSKIVASNQEDGQRCVDPDRWIQNKWEMLPDATDFHITRGFEWAWKSVKVIDDNELPEAVRKSGHVTVKRSNNVVVF